MTLRPDAGRYECGTLNTIGCYGLRASIGLLLEVGVDAVAPAVQRLGDLVADGVQAKGYEVLGSSSPANGAGIVSFRKPGLEAGSIVQKLMAAGVPAAPRQGWGGVCPDISYTPGDNR